MARNAAAILNPNTERDYLKAQIERHGAEALGLEPEWVAALLAGERVEYVTADGEIVAVDEYDEAPRKYRGEIDDSPEAVKARAEAKQRRAEALAYVTEYRGNWGLILDLRADRRWGTKHFRMSDRLVEILLAAKARDAARVTEISEAQRALVAQAFEALAANPARRPEFIVSIVAQGQVRPLSEKQTACLVRFVAEAAPAAEPKAIEQASPEGFYSRDGVIYKVQHNLSHTGFYAKRLDVVDGKGEWTFVAGLARTLRPEERLTLEQAAAFGHLYGICGICGRELTDEASIERGIGPVCMGKVA